MANLQGKEKKRKRKEKRRLQGAAARRVACADSIMAKHCRISLLAAICACAGIQLLACKCLCFAQLTCIAKVGCSVLLLLLLLLQSSEEEEEAEGTELQPRYERRVRQAVQRYSPPKDEAQPMKEGARGASGGRSGSAKRRGYQQDRADSDSEEVSGGQGEGKAGQEAV